MGTSAIVPPDITLEENQRRIRRLEQVLSNILDYEITLEYKTPEEIEKEEKVEGNRQ